MTLTAILTDLMEYDIAVARLGRAEMLNCLLDELPNECVGYLWSDGSITRLVNQARSPWRFSVSTTLMAEALAKADPEVKQLVGLFHSHPGGSLALSETDIECIRLQFAAGVDYPWVIVTTAALMIWWWDGETNEPVGVRVDA